MHANVDNAAELPAKYLKIGKMPRIIQISALKQLTKILIITNLQNSRDKCYFSYMY